MKKDMSCKWMVFLVITFLFQSIVSNAQEVLSLDECRRMAIDNNKKLKIADENIKASAEEKANAFTKYLPNIDATGLYLRNQKKINLLKEDGHLPVGSLDENGNFTFRPDQLLTDANGVPVQVDGQYVPKDYALLPKEAMSGDIRNTALFQVGLTQPIYLGGKIRAYNQIAGLSEDLVKTGRDEVYQEVILKTDEAYWQVVSLTNRKTTAEKFVQTLQQLLNNVEMMYEAGVANKADVLLVRVKLNEAEMLSTKVNNGLSLSRMALNQIVGLPLETDVVLKEEFTEPVYRVVPKESMNEVLKRRPEIEGLRIGVDIFKKKEKLAASEHLPNVAFMANYIYLTPSFFNGVTTKFDGMWSVGVGVQAPIFHWGSSRKSVRKAKAETQAMSYQLDEAKELIELQVSQAELKMKEVEKTLRLAYNNMDSAEENLKNANLGYKEGVIPILTVMEAQTAWYNASSDLIDAKIDAQLSKVYLEKAYGILGLDEIY